MAKEQEMGCRVFPFVCLHPYQPISPSVTPLWLYLGIRQVSHAEHLKNPFSLELGGVRFVLTEWETWRH